jgi:hypothetical protein
MGYTAPAEVCKSGPIPIFSGTPMSRTAAFIILVLLLAGGIYVLSTVPKQEPVKSIEIDVPQSGNAQ